MRRNKYNKALSYRTHPYLIDTFNMPFLMKNFIRTGIILVGFKVFDLGFEHYSIIRSIGLASILCLSVYKYGIRPNLYNGNIQAFYRRNYEKVSGWNDFYFSISIGFASAFVIYSLFDLWKGISLYHIFQQNPLIDVFRSASNPLGFLLAFLMLLWRIYRSFFEDKYVSIKEFSDKINYQMKFNEKTFSEALALLCQEKDQEYDVKEFDGTYFDIQGCPVKEAKETAQPKKETLIRREMREE